MELLTKEIREKLPRLWSQQEVDDPIAYVKFFTPDAGWTWYATEGSPDIEDDCVFFGYVEGVEAGWGTFSLRELMDVRGPFGLPVERDLYFRPCPVSEVKRRRNLNASASASSSRGHQNKLTTLPSHGIHARC